MLPTLNQALLFLLSWLQRTLTLLLECGLE